MFYIKTIKIQPGHLSCLQVYCQSFSTNARNGVPGALNPGARPYSCFTHFLKMLAIGAMPDHIHILIGYNVNQLIHDLVEEIKTSYNSWIKGGKLYKFKFEWQKGYGAFTHSRSQIDTVAKYILTQEEHHKTKPFKEEY